MDWAKKGLEEYPNSVSLWFALAKVTEKVADDWHEAIPVYIKTAEIDGTAPFPSAPK